MSVRKVFFTFGGGSELYRQSAYRLKADVAATGVFDEINAFTDGDLAEGGEFSDFSRSHGAFLARSPRGYGYWLWKPYFIKRLFERLEYGDVVVYADAGCELSPEVAHLRAFVNHAASDGQSFGDCRSPLTRGDSTEYLFDNGAVVLSEGHGHVEYVKADLLTRFKNVTACFDRQMCMATTMALQKNSETMSLVNDWYELAQLEDYRFIDDSPSESLNSPVFVEHRHDQAILSLLLYSRWPEYEFSVLPYLAFKPLRNRSGKDSAVLENLIKLSVALEIPRHLVKLAQTSSTSLFSRSQEDPYSFIFYPIRSFLFSPAAPAFAFHTECEARPYWECFFVRPIYLDRLVIFNRPGLEHRAVPLCISGYDTEGNLLPLMRVDLPFGGAHDKSPLVVEIGSRIGRFSGVNLQFDGESPTYFHLARIMICVPKWDL